MDNGEKNCKYCQSQHVIKYGTVKGIQRYYCKDCRHKFVSGDTIPKMQTPTKVITDSLNMHYEGMSLAEIRRNFVQQDSNYVSLGWLS
jgi:transposase-like protein